MATTITDRATLFESVRPRLFGIGYRMLGSIEDGEDVVQETFLRWQRAEPESIREPEGWLVAVATRLSIDRLRRARTEREAYVGQWLPEPLPEEPSDLASDLSVAFLLLLERLTPEERAALLLREVFESDYREIAHALEKTEAACRQLVHRARQRVRRERRRFEVPREAAEQLVDRFLTALHHEDKDALLALVSDDATWISDGGGKVSAVRNVVRGALPIVRMLLGFKRKEGGLVTHRLVRLNGEVAWVGFVGGKVFYATSFATDGARILGVYRVLNPDKLTRVGAALASR